MDSKMKVSRLPGGINVLDDGYWLWFASNEYYEYLKGKKGKKFDDITGKYLFFHENLKILSQIAVTEIKKGGFHVAKVNQKITGTGRDHVLCLYYKDDSLKGMLAKKYQDKNGIQYRYWKSDEDTRKGKYSKQFLDQLKTKP